MKKKIILFPLLLSFAYILLTGYSSGPGVTGGIHGTVTGCGGGSCHGSSSTSSTTVSMQLLNSSMAAVTSYVPGGTYFVRITGIQTSGSFTLANFGFQVATLNSGGSSVGSLSAIGGTHTSSPGGINVVEHNSPIGATTGSGGSGSTYVVTLPWTAPTTGTGNVNLRGAINAVNGGGADAGDKWNTGSAAVTEFPAITGGTTPICISATTTLSNSFGPGTWLSGTPSVATVNLITGLVTGAGVGTSIITFTAGGNSVTKIVSVNAAPGSTITGTLAICQGQTSLLSNSVAGGTWNSGTPAVATITSGGLVSTGIAGTSTITYAIGTCSVTAVFSVNAQAANTGTASVCTGNSTSLSNVNSGGTWSSSVTAVGTVNASGMPGIVAGLTAGTTDINYILPTGCTSTTIVSVNQTPAAIGGTLVVCSSATVAATNTFAGGIWTSSAGTGTAGVVTGTGVITGGAPGTANITYTLPGGCFTTAIVSINPLPNAITGTTTFCANLATTLNSTTTGGTWTSGNTSVANIGASNGIVTAVGVAGGTAPISYTLSTGCLRTATVSVHPISPVSGTFTVCPGSSTTLTSSPATGTWSSVSTGVATVVPTTGAVTGVTGGTSTIIYTTGAGCTSNAVVSVSVVAPITGTMSGCVGGTLTLSNSISGGTWASSVPLTGTVNASTGVVAAIAAGTTTISYTTVSGCVTTAVVTVEGLPAAVSGTGAGTFCGSATIGATGGSGGTIYYQGTTSGGTSTATPSASQVVSTTGNYYFRSQSAGGCWGPEAAIGIVINPLPAAIGGTASVCLSATTALTNTTAGGNWSSSLPSIASIDASTGIATGVAVGTATITYTLPSTSCFITRIVTVTTAPAVVTVSGAGTFCGSTFITATGGAGGTIYFQGTTSGGTSTATASSSQTITSSGTYYFRSQAAGGCWGAEGSVTVTINPLPDPITGVAVLCANGATTTLSTTSAGGTWSSSLPSVATVSGSGLVTGLLAGTSTIIYTITATGCTTTRVVTVNGVPAAISGAFEICVGSTIPFGATGMTWSSSDPTVASIHSTSGLLTGVSAGTSTITVSFTMTGCYRTRVLTVNPVPGVITSGSTTLCVGTTISLSNSTSGGTWSTASSTISLTSTGDVTGVSPGTAMVNYTLSTGCGAVTILTVNPLPASIAGVFTVCAGSNVLLTNSTAGGTWISGTTANAIIGSSSGVVTGVAAGTSLISYILPTGCRRTATMNINPVPSAITGSAITCVGVNTTLSGTPAGGTWTSSNTAVATVVSSTGVVSGIATGTTNITYTLSTGCFRITPVTVNATASAGTITGSTSLCTGLTATLSSSVSGGTWNSGTTSVATIDGSGVVTGVTAGTSTITYTVTGACGIVTSTVDITVTTSASAGTLSGPSAVCAGSTITLSSTVLGGTWVSGTPAVASAGFTSGVISGSTAGTTIVTYTISSSCGVASTTRTITVNSLPGSIGGTAVVCVNANTTLTNPASGTWASANNSIAIVGSSTGVVTGVSAGTTTITFTAGTGCFVTRIVTVIALPAPIDGTLTLCAGSSTTLTNSSGAGTWTSSSAPVATIGSSTGIVLALGGGNSVIGFTLTSTGCIRTATLTVNPNPASITGTGSMCAGATTTLNSTTAGGTWTSSNGAVATVGSSTGIVTGIGSGTSFITYTVATGCRRVTTVTVNAIPPAIGGTLVVCEGGSTTLTNITSGTWSSSNAGVATINPTTGVATGVSSGAVTITFTASSGCFRTATLNVNPVPAGITGTMVLCAGSTTTLASTTTGGLWISGTTSVATVITGSGVVTGTGSGTSVITYSIATGCYALATVTVNPLPVAITGTPSVCVGSTRTFTTTTTGGTWTSSSPAAGSIDAATGVLTGIAIGTTTITYTLPTGCFRTATITVNPVPAAITGASAVCAGSTTTLSNSTPSGTWTSSSSTTATIAGSTGLLTGILAGTSNITYTLGTGCSAVTTITVNALPAVIGGAGSVCVAATATVSSTPGGGTWSSSAPAIGSIVAATGVVTGVAPGTTMITYSLSTGCARTATLTINPLPVAGTVSGTATVCIAATSALASTVSGGVWSNSTGKVSLSLAGVMTGVSAGVDTVIYTVSTVCGTATTRYPVTVNAMPAAGTISGSGNVCVTKTTNLSGTVSGGTWSSSNTGIATVSSTGVVTGVLVGTATISYTVTTACGSAVATTVATVNPLVDPGTIAGSDTVCQADTVHLSNAITGGTWSSSNAAVATVTSAGIVAGITPGTAIIRYRVTNICSADTATLLVTVRSISSCATSVQPVTTNTISGIKLYPNPTHGVLSVETSVAGTLTIFAIDGKEVTSYTVKAGNTSITIPKGISGGVYMCRFAGNDGSNAVVRLVYEP